MIGVAMVATTLKDEVRQEEPDARFLAANGPHQLVTPLHDPAVWTRLMVSRGLLLGQELAGSFQKLLLAALTVQVNTT